MLASNEKAILREEFKRAAKEFFSAHSVAELKKIHAGIAEKLAAYCHKIFATNNPPTRVALYKPLRYELPAEEIAAGVEMFRNAELLFPEYNETDMWFVAKATGEKAEPDFVLVPGLFVDRAGHRIGRGKGYYDRYFKKSPLPIERRLFLGYPFQFLTFVPTTPDDVSVALVNSAETPGR